MKWIIILYVLLVLSSCQNKLEGYVIKGELKGAPENEWVFLTDVDQDVFYDSVQLKKGHFEFKGNVVNRSYVASRILKIPRNEFMDGIKS